MQRRRGKLRRLPSSSLCRVRLFLRLGIHRLGASVSSSRPWRSLPFATGMVGTNPRTAKATTLRDGRADPLPRTTQVVPGCHRGADDRPAPGRAPKPRAGREGLCTVTLPAPSDDMVEGFFLPANGTAVATGATVSPPSLEVREGLDLGRGSARKDALAPGIRIGGPTDGRLASLDLSSPVWFTVFPFQRSSCVHTVPIAV